jgi:hypothetical protein
VQFAGGASPWGRELWAVLSFEGIILAPVSLYFYAVYPDWAWMFFVDPHRLPWGVSALVLLAYVAALVGGYLAGWALARAHRDRLLYGALAVSSLVLLVFLTAARARLWSSGTFAQYHAGHAPGLGESKLGWSLAICSVGVIAGTLLVGFTLWEQGRRYR